MPWDTHRCSFPSSCQEIPWKVVQEKEQRKQRVCEGEESKENTWTQSAGDEKGKAHKCACLHCSLSYLFISLSSLLPSIPPLLLFLLLFWHFMKAAKLRSAQGWPLLHVTMQGRQREGKNQFREMKNVRNTSSLEMTLRP